MLNVENCKHFNDISGTSYAVSVTQPQWLENIQFGPIGGTGEQTPSSSVAKEKLQSLPVRIFQNKTGNGECDFRSHCIIYFHKAKSNYTYINAYV